MSQLKLIKISSTGEQLADGAAEWDAVLLPDHGLMFTATNVAEDAPHADCEAACKASRVAGFDDWAMPDIDQLQLLIDRSRCSPAINTDFFRGIANDWYWTTTPAAWSSASAWVVYFDLGSVDSGPRDYSGFALAVRRAGQ
ncbi:MAG TPA: DUF1566 domain-containing protein [Luteimonas sp.]|nr:DUF1566 domain-containing protein [Luteimonas sp.]